MAVLRRVLGLSLQQGLLFRETTLDEALVQRVLWRQLLKQGCVRRVRRLAQAWQRLVQVASLPLRAGQALNPKLSLMLSRARRAPSRQG